MACHQQVGKCQPLATTFAIAPLEHEEKTRQYPEHKRCNVRSQQWLSSKINCHLFSLSYLRLDELPRVAILRMCNFLVRT